MFTRGLLRPAVPAIAGVVLSASVLIARDQIEAIPHPALPRGQGTITGVVLGDNERPVAGATVVVKAYDHYSPNYPESLYGNRETVTDASGRFTVVDLPSLPLELSASMAGYTTSVYGQAAPGLDGTPIQLNALQSLSAVIRLSRGASISGTMLDAQGIPAAGLRAFAFRVTPMGGDAILLGGGGEAVTDDRGEFRIGDLPAGKYIVTGYRVWGNHERSPLQRVAENQWAIESGTVYRNATRYEAAEHVELRLGESRTGIDLRVTLEPATTATGTVREADGNPAGGVRVQLFSRTSQPFVISEATTRDDGTFELGRVTPDEYDVKAFSQSAVPRRGQTAFSSDGIRQARLTIDLGPGATVTGRVVYSGRSAPDASRPLTLFFSRMRDGTRDGVPGLAYPVASPDFTYRGVPPGHYTIFVNRESLPPGWYPQSEMVDGVDAFDFPFEVRGTETRHVVITVSDAMSEIAGVVIGADGGPQTALTVVVFATDESYWGPLSRRVETIRPDTNGAYRFWGLPPGDYVLALASPATFGRPPTTLLRQLRTSGTRITVRGGGKYTVNLTAR